jgi:hypothetical protein
MLTTALLIAGLSTLSMAADAPQFEPWVHATEYSRKGPTTVDYLLGLGALQKIGGRWQHKHSEALGGELTSVTWQLKEGFTAEEAFAWYAQQLPGDAQLLFECGGRSCGSSAQWANRVFDERVLYGHDERQHYAAWRLSKDDVSWVLVLYAVDRANRRHFLRMDLLQQDP